MTDPNVMRCSKLDTAAVSDALDRLGIPGQCRGIKPRDHAFRMCGRAFTVLYGPRDHDKGSVGDFLDEVPVGHVVVLDNGGREDATVWGDIMTFLADRNGVAGTVIDGACRDVHLCLELGYPVFTRSFSMRTGKDRVTVEGLNVPVNIGDARVAPGDILLGDSDGVVVIPRAREAEVLRVAEEISEVEDRIRTALRAGKTLRQARAELGYHDLQTKD